MSVFRNTPSQRRLLFYATIVVVFILIFLHLSSSPHYDQIPNYAPLKTTTPSSSIAIATFLSSNSPVQDSNESLNDNDDVYFIAARVLTYQLLHEPLTRSNRSVPIPFHILCTTEVTLSKRQRLERDGAIVTVVADVPLPRWVSTGVTRWRDQFTKLRIFEMEQYERVLFIDADTLLTAPMDGIFNLPMIATPMTTLYTAGRSPYAVRTDELPLPSNYTFAARSDNAFSGERAHPFPPPPTLAFSAGFWVAAPSREMFAYLLSVMRHWRRFDPHTMEQSLLNYAFRREGAMPWYDLPSEWSATWPSGRDWGAGVRSFHEKWWREGLEGVPEEGRAAWEGARGRMEAFQSESV